MLSGINWIAVIIGAVFNMGLGILWYGPFFGRFWLTLSGVKAEDANQTPLMYLLPFVAAIASSFMVALVIGALGIVTWSGGLLWGALIWLFLGGAATLTNATFERPNFATWVMFAAYQLIVHAVLGCVFVLW